jgi:hypothetical protein
VSTTNNSMAGLQQLTAQELQQELQSVLGEVITAHNAMQSLMETTRIPGVVLPHAHQAKKQLKTTGDHISAALTLLEGM